MNDFKIALTKEMYNFVKKHLDEFKIPVTKLGFKNEKVMLNKIKSNTIEASWALTELLRWGMSQDYSKQYLVDEEEGVYKIGEYYFVVEHFEPIIVKKITKLVEVVEWIKTENYETKN